jgi:ABC-type multidrug transport system ATPase subunit
VTALRDVTLCARSGSKIGLVGPNGSGKSTLLRVLTGVVEAEGEIRLGGLDPARDRDTIAANRTYVPQIAPRLAASVGEIVRTIGSVRGLAPETIADTARLLDLDVYALARQSFRDLSGGSRQKLLLAFALTQPTPLLVLDEPTASLDPAARLTFLRLCRERTGESTVVVASHRLEELRELVDRVVVLADGVVASEERRSGDA